MRVVLLTNGQANQKALAHRIAEVADVAAVVVSRNIPRSKPSLRKRFRLALNAVGGRTVGKPLVEAWKEMLAGYLTEYPDFPTDDVVRVDNVNAAVTAATIRDRKPDLVLVSGTNLVGRAVIEAANERGGILNLHTGISPYVRGGPNCTNWCLAKGWFDRIGNTIMWLDLGIDTGNLIATERTRLDGSESLSGLQRKVMDHGHELYKGVVERLASGQSVPSVRQSEVDEGSHFNSVDWTAMQMTRAIRNFREEYPKFFRSDNQNVRPLNLFPLADG